MLQKQRVVRPTGSNFLGFTYWESKEGWKCRPNNKSKRRLYNKCRQELIRKKCVALPLAKTFKRMNEIVHGWINYFVIGNMNQFMKEFGEWLRHKIRVITLKQWKKPKTIFRNLMILNIRNKNRFSEEEIYATANTRLGLYRQAGQRTVNYILNPKLLATGKGDRPGLVDPLKYYLSRRTVNQHINVAPYTRTVRTVQ